MVLPTAGCFHLPGGFCKDGEPCALGEVFGFKVKRHLWAPLRAMVLTSFLVGRLAASQLMSPPRTSAAVLGASEGMRGLWMGLLSISSQILYVLSGFV